MKVNVPCLHVETFLGVVLVLHGCKVLKRPSKLIMNRAKGKGLNERVVREKDIGEIVNYLEKKDEEILRLRMKVMKLEKKVESYEV